MQPRSGVDFNDGDVLDVGIVVADVGFVLDAGLVVDIFFIAVIVADVGFGCW